MLMNNLGWNRVKELCVAIETWPCGWSMFSSLVLAFVCAIPGFISKSPNEPRRGRDLPFIMRQPLRCRYVWTLMDILRNWLKMISNDYTLGYASETKTYNQILLEALSPTFRMSLFNRCCWRALNQFVSTSLKADFSCPSLHVLERWLFIQIQRYHRTWTISSWRQYYLMQRYHHTGTASRWSQ